MIPNLRNQTYLPSQTFKNKYINNNLTKTNEFLLNKDKITAWQVKAGPELGTTQPQLVNAIY